MMRMLNTTLMLAARIAVIGASVHLLHGVHPNLAVLAVIHIVYGIASSIFASMIAAEEKEKLKKHLKEALKEAKRDANSSDDSTRTLN